ncbi:MAG: sugar kinase [Candidatus Rokuibacteriota bacterium]|nr:MAG: sugar kinase [Candidatus Rokubacteria bacterium]
MSAQRVIGVDVGGTKILVGVVSRQGRVEARREHVTPLDSEQELVDGIAGAVEELAREVSEAAAVGIGIPSPVDQTTGEALGAVNIPLRDYDLRERLSARLSLPVGIENDASAAAFGEWAFGAGRGCDDLVALTLGTGVGGGLVLAGRPFRGWAELGHIVIEVDGIPCQGACTGRGHLEAYCSGRAADVAARETFGEAADSHRLVRLAREGEPEAVEVLDGIGRRLGAGIGSLVNVVSPQAVVIGGGFGVAAFEFLLPGAREVVAREVLDGAGEHVPIVQAELGTAAGLVGAALVAFEALDEG